MPERSDLDLHDMRRRLIERRDELLRLAETTKEAVRPVELDQTTVGRLSRMDALQVHAMAVETERRRAVELARIGAALQRLDADDYGYCVKCDGEIPRKRLEIDPTAAVCVACLQAPED